MAKSGFLYLSMEEVIAFAPSVGEALAIVETALIPR